MPRKFVLKPVFRYVLQPYWRLTRGQTLGVRAVVLDRKDRVLLVRHSYAPGWMFPGGGVERDESLDQAVRRELVEEVGVHLETGAELIGVYANFAAFRSDHIALFVARKWRQTPVRSIEIAEQGFFSVDDLPDDTTGGTRRRLIEILQDTEIATHW